MKASLEERLLEARRALREHSEKGRELQTKVQCLVAEIAEDKGIKMTSNSAKAAAKDSLESILGFLVKAVGKAQNDMDQALRYANDTTKHMRLSSGRPHDYPADKTYYGFWRNAQNPDLPMPVSNAQMSQDTQEVAAALLFLQVEGYASRETYRGWSECRLCGVCNGNAEFSIDGYVWPAGYVHYLQAHNVEPPQDLKDRLVETFKFLGAKKE